MKITIKPAKSIDPDLLAGLCQGTFRTAWTEPGNEKDIDQYIEENFTRDKIAEELQDSTILYFIAEVNDKIAGYAKLTRDLQPDNYILEKPISLNRLYVIKEFQNCGIGKLFLEKIIETAKAENYINLWLGVWNENPGAIRLYENKGFVKFGTYRFVMGSTYSDDYLMKIDLTKLNL